VGGRSRADGRRTRAAILRQAADLATVNGLDELTIGTLAETAQQPWPRQRATGRPAAILADPLLQRLADVNALEGLASDCGNNLEVLIEVQDGQPGEFGGGGDN
jgi:hypothetical protein